MDKKSRTNVKWDSIILPSSKCGLKILDPKLQENLLQAKVMIRHLSQTRWAPWKTFIRHCVTAICQTNGSLWNANSH